MIEAQHICAIIPTYNNAGTIASVARGVYAHIRNIIIVADGPTDNTLEVLQQLDVPFTLVHYAQNKGKGHALKMGFQKAREMGFSHALTIDSDGQHYPDDIPSLYRMHTLHPQAIIIGSRGLKQDNMPGKNTFANKFSNFWFAVQTGTYLPDTQTGFRIYPLQEIHGEWAMTRRYEAELALLVFSAWANVEIMPVAVRVYYPPKEERVSHFKPAYDFTRISILNTLLCVLAICYGLPRRWFWSIGYYLLFGLETFLVIQPGCLYLRLRYGDTPEMRHKLHIFMQKCAHWFLHCHPQVDYVIRRVEGATPIDENEPCMLIANHSSLLDTLMVMTIHTKVAIVTKEWVTKNPLFGFVAKCFDILPTTQSLDDMLPTIQERIDKGFSIMFFPEGTRTKDGELGRFHRGAFYIAEKFKLPIRPIVVRGTYTALNKATWHTGLPKEISANIGPLVKADDKTFGEDYKERTKRFAAWYKERIDNFAFPYQDSKS